MSDPFMEAILQMQREYGDVQARLAIAAIGASARLGVVEEGHRVVKRYLEGFIKDDQDEAINALCRGAIEIIDGVLSDKETTVAKVAIARAEAEKRGEG